MYLTDCMAIPTLSFERGIEIATANKPLNIAEKRAMNRSMAVFAIGMEIAR